ncbi:MAG: hypothetical protein JSW54_02485 [Fidelibacterota bacterium]|nr:MAG: hypothetical protein JSW54_02485 [Candidatus Neomarinimicrobiota bacterium]
MVRVAALPWLAMVFFVLGIHPTGAQEKFPPEEDKRGSPEERDERHEGIRKYENVSAGLEMKSAVVVYHENHPESREYFHLDFYIDQAIQQQEIEILIEDSEGKSYYMMPVRKHWESGVQTFLWNSSFARSHGLEVENLYAFAHVSRHGLLSSIVPIAVYHDTEPTKVVAYEFVFFAGRKVTLKYSIYDEQGKLADSGILRYQPENSEIIIIWDCRDAPDGAYELLVKYTYADGDVEEYSNLYEFYHLNILN